MSRVSFVSNQLLEFLTLSRKQSLIECLEVKTDPQLQIRDHDEDNKPCVFEAKVTEDENVFSIDNPTTKELCFIAVDQCLLFNDSPKRCDCILFDDQTFCFIELKLSVTSRRQGAARAKEAREQLEHTIQYFLNNIDHILKGYLLEAYVVMHPTIYPKRSASRDIVFERFRNDLGIHLFEQNWKKF